MFCVGVAWVCGGVAVYCVRVGSCGFVGEPSDLIVWINTLSTQA